IEEGSVHELSPVITEEDSGYRLLREPISNSPKRELSKPVPMPSRGADFSLHAVVARLAEQPFRWLGYRRLVIPDPRLYTHGASPRGVNDPGASTHVRHRLGHPLDWPAPGWRTSRLSEALGALCPPPGRAGPEAAPGRAPLGGRRGGCGAERLR